MEYRDFQRKHPEWPKRLGDVDGRHARMRFETENGRGVIFLKGDEVEIRGSYRGQLELRRGSDTITRVGLGMVELLPKGEGGSPLSNCARCGETHAEVRWRRFGWPCGDLTHWTPCPKTGEPVLMKMVDLPEDEG